MNNSKKLKTKKVKKDRLLEQKPITKISKPWLILSAVLIAILIIGLLFDEFYESTLMTVDGDKYKMSDLSYYFYTVEYQYDYYDQMFGGNGAYWNMTTDEESGTTVRDLARTEAIEVSLYNELLYKEAIAEGYTLTEEEKETVNTNATNMMSQLPDSIKRKNDFTEKYLASVLSKTTLVERFRKDKIDSLDIDDEAIKADIKYEDYRQYDIEYLFVSTTTTDEDGNSVALSDEEKKAAYDKLNSYYETAKTTEDWSKLLPKEEEAVTYGDTDFVESDTTYSEDFEAMMMAMDNGAVSEIYEEEDGYYIVRMVDNNSSESYDTAVKDAITTAENEAFDEVYEDIKEKHEYSTNDRAVKRVPMGS